MRQKHPDPRGFLMELFNAAVAAAAASQRIPPHLPPPPKGHTRVIGAGKAAAAMAKAVEENWPGELSGLVVTRYGHGVACSDIEVIEAGHPLPDAAACNAAQRMLEQVQELAPDDLVLALVSGGGSSLLTLPAKGITLSDKQAISHALLKSGARIGEINCVRKHLSAIKGGRLALAAYPAQVVTLAISDVPGDDPGVIASGPTVADPTRCADALAILERYDIDTPPSVRMWLESAAAETPKPGDFRFEHCATRIVATAQDALAAAAQKARAAGVVPLLLGDSIQGEAREVARAMAAQALSCATSCVLLSGGETTVTVRGSGRGGRNAEFLLALAIALDGNARIHALACDTDGIDGTEDNAGAYIAPDTLRRARAAGINATARLADNDAYGFFAAIGDLVVTGPTHTNVNDFRAILVDPCL